MLLVSHVSETGLNLCTAQGVGAAYVCTGTGGVACGVRCGVGTMEE